MAQLTVQAMARATDGVGGGLHEQWCGQQCGQGHGQQMEWAMGCASNAAGVTDSGVMCSTVVIMGMS